MYRRATLAEIKTVLKEIINKVNSLLLSAAPLQHLIKI